MGVPLRRPDWSLSQQSSSEGRSSRSLWRGALQGPRDYPREGVAEDGVRDHVIAFFLYCRARRWGRRDAAGGSGRPRRRRRSQTEGIPTATRPQSPPPRRAPYVSAEAPPPPGPAPAGRLGSAGGGGGEKLQLQLRVGPLSLGSAGNRAAVTAEPPPPRSRRFPGRGFSPAGSAMAAAAAAAANLTPALSARR